MKKLKKYGVLIHGTGYDLLDEQENTIIRGFYVSVFVESTNIDEACQQAIELLVNSDKYTTTFPPDQHPNGMLQIETVDELYSFDDVPCLMISGFSFYKNDDSHDDKTTQSH